MYEIQASEHGPLLSLQLKQENREPLNIARQSRLLSLLIINNPSPVNNHLSASGHLGTRCPLERAGMQSQHA